MAVPRFIKKRVSVNQAFKAFIKSDGWSYNGGYAADYEELPSDSGLYILVVFDWCNLSKRQLKPYVAYVGKSLNLERRLSGHEVINQLREDLPSSSYPAIFFMPMGADQIDKMEIYFIKKYDPPYNLVHRVKKPLEIAA